MISTMIAATRKKRLKNSASPSCTYMPLNAVTVTPASMKLEKLNRSTKPSAAAAA